MAEKKKKSNVADAAFKKKVTIINGCILLAFIIALVSFLVYTWSMEESYPERFAAEVEAAKQAATVTDSDKSVIDIDVTDETFVDWILELDHSYQHKDSEHFECFEGNTIHLQGVFESVKINDKTTEYWVYRKYIDVDNGENKVPISVVFEGDIPEDGAWVDVVGIVSSKYGISCIKDAKVTVLDSSEKREIVK
ncbi:MAG: hypothetical protein IKC01_03135 [Clostridia bacterium]|nr:hypothetical protein [Clostridia bacterium]